MGAALRKTQRDLEKINEKNSKSLLVKLSPELFDNVIGRLDLDSFLALKLSCKAVNGKCQNVARGPFLTVERLYFDEGIIQLDSPWRKGNPVNGIFCGQWIYQLKFQIRCKKEVRIMGKRPEYKLGDEDMKSVFDLLYEYQLKAKRLTIMMDVDCDPYLFQKLVKKLQISEFDCQRLAPQLTSLPFWKKLDVVSTQSVFPDKSLLLQARFKELTIEFTRLDFSTFGTVLQELKTDARSLISWSIENVPWSREEFDEKRKNLKDINNRRLLDKSPFDKTCKLFVPSTNTVYFVSLTPHGNLRIWRDRFRED